MVDQLFCPIKNFWPAPNAHGWPLFASVAPRKEPSAIVTLLVKAFVGQRNCPAPLSVRVQPVIAVPR